MNNNIMAQALSQLSPNSNQMGQTTAAPAQLSNTSKLQMATNNVVNSQPQLKAQHDALMSQLDGIDYQLNRLGFPGVQQFARLKAGGYNWTPQGWTGPGIGSQPASQQIQQDVNLRGGGQ